jgi:class 3 adenylate cyclase
VQREQIRQAVVGQAELRSGHLPGARRTTVGFVDIVGFTSLGEQVPPDELAEVVNLASRLTASARPGGVVTAREVRDAAGEGFAWSFVGSRRFKGVRGEVDVYRVRPRSDGRPD